MIQEQFVARAPVYEDVESVAALADAVARAAHGQGAHESRWALLNTWYGAEQEFSRSLNGKHLLLFDGSQRLIAYLETVPEPEEGFFWFSLLVHPEYQSEGLYEILREQAEAWGREWAASQPGGDIQILSEAWAQDGLKRRHLEAAGYVPVRIYHRMQIELDAPPSPTELAAGFTIRLYRRGEDDEQIYSAWREAMADDWGSATSLTFEEFMFYKVASESERDLALWRFAMRGNEIAGFTIARWERAGEPDTGHIRDVGVRRAFRRQGLGLALLGATFDGFYRLGKRRVSLGVDGYNPNGAVQLYHRAGMRAVLTQYKYGKALTDQSAVGTLYANFNH